MKFSVHSISAYTKNRMKTVYSLEESFMPTINGSNYFNKQSPEYVLDLVLFYFLFLNLHLFLNNNILNSEK